MLPELMRRYAPLERQQTGALARLNGWGPEQVRFRPTPTCWSALEVLDHIIKVERASREAAEGNLATGGATAAQDPVRRTAVMMVMRAPTMIKVPDAAQFVLPEVRESLPEMATLWSEERARLRATLESFQAGQERLLVFNHPVGGWMHVGHMLLFLTCHLQHHGYQWRRIAREYSRSPGGRA